MHSAKLALPWLLVASAIAQTPVTLSQQVAPDTLGPVLDHHLLFVGSDPQHGFELWKTDGTPTGTVLVADVYPGPANGFTSRDPVALVPGGFQGFRVGDLVLFFAEDATTPQGLYRTDGTAAGTFKIADVPVDNPYGYPLFGAVVNGSLVFGGMANGTWRLLRSDGTAAGTGPIANIRPQRAVPFAVHDGLAWFSAVSFGIWSTDGTAAGTRMRVLAPGQRPFGFAGDSILFCTGNTPSYELNAQSAAGLRTTLLSGFRYPPRNFTVHEGRTYFTGWTPALGEELYVTDGTPAGTSLVLDLVAGPGGIDPTQLISTPRGLMFASRGGDVYITDGTAANTTRIASCGFGRPGPLFSLGSRFTLIPCGPTDVLRHGTNGVAPWFSTPAANQLRWLDGRLVFASTTVTPTGTAPVLMALPTDAVAQTIGAGCGPVQLTAADPVLGTTMPLSIGPGAPGTPGYLLVDPGPSTTTRIAPGCEALVSTGSFVVPFALGATGQWLTSIPIPNIPALTGFPVVAQAALVAGAGRRPVDLTNALELHFDAN